MNTIQIKEEFKKLIPALTQEEFKQLEENCLKEGIREAILTWDGYIIDGHNRYEIAQKWNLDFNTKSKHFDNEEAVKEWMILNQFGRRNLSNYQRSVLALQLEEVFSLKAKENQKGGQGGVLLKQKSAEANSIETRKELAKVANVSHDTIAKVKKIEAVATPEVKAQLSTGEISINQAYQEIKASENKDIKNELKLNNYEKIQEVTELKLIQNDIYMFTISSEQKENRFGDKLMSLKDESYYTVTTLERFFHRETGIEFSLREYANVQMFPKDFKFVGNYSSIKKQIGNAVSPFMGEYISKELEGKTCGDIFSGCGGFTMGLHKNKIISKWSIEWENVACQSYKLNFPETKVICANIIKVNPLELEKVDIIIGGPPCQGFSNAGSEKRNSLQRFIEDPRNKLYKEFVRFVDNLKPKEFIMENVKEIEQFKEEIIKDFEFVGYKVKTKLVTGNEIGMKQNRKRFFFIGKLI